MRIVGKSRLQLDEQVDETLHLMERVFVADISVQRVRSNQPLYVVADSVQLGQVISAVCKNAVEAMKRKMA